MSLSASEEQIKKEDTVDLMENKLFWIAQYKREQCKLHASRVTQPSHRQNNETDSHEKVLTS